MNLTRDEWLDLWKAIKKIEKHSKIKNSAIYCKQDLAYDISTIKDGIQKVIGQME